ncbi:MAG: hypothetical protein K2H70_02695, partial [Bacteroidales bacterium]|nr:hypothetical protein [Bacteroidales bacterium]
MPEYTEPERFDSAERAEPSSLELCRGAKTCLEKENFSPESETEETEVFLRKTVEENIYNSRGCAHAPNLQDSANDRCRQMGCCAQMHAYNWTDNLDHLPSPDPFDLVEVRFKNTHKDFFRLPEDRNESFASGDIVAVEGNSGHDIGIICLT